MASDSVILRLFKDTVIGLLELELEAILTPSLSLFTISRLIGSSRGGGVGLSLTPVDAFEGVGASFFSYAGGSL